MIRTFALATTLALAAPAFAEKATVEAETAEVVQIGPTVGEAAPEFSATTTAGEAATLASLSGESGVAVVFVRSADWCPFCKGQMKDLEAAVAPLNDAGWGLASLSYDSVETLADFKAEAELSYTLLSDTDSAVIDAFALRNTDVRAGSQYDGIPHPAIVFIRADGSVAAVLREEGFKDRPQVDVVIETASQLNAAAG